MIIISGKIQTKQAKSSDKTLTRVLESKGFDVYELGDYLLCRQGKARLMLVSLTNKDKLKIPTDYYCCNSMTREGVDMLINEGVL